MRAVYDQGSQAALTPIAPRIDFNALHLEGIFVNPFERGEIGPDLFRAACRMGLEGLVSKIGPIVAADARTRSRSKTDNTRLARTVHSQKPAFRPQCLGSIPVLNWAGAVYALELQTF